LGNQVNIRPRGDLRVSEVSGNLKGPRGSLDLGFEALLQLEGTSPSYSDETPAVHWVLEAAKIRSLGHPRSSGLER
jgi:hypothetical protein